MIRLLILAFALVNASLYACFLPLWEGFDEPFHYAYVQTLAAGRFPVFGKAKVSAEIVASFRNVPLSRFLSGSTGTTSFEEWFTLSASERQRRFDRVVDPVLRHRESDLENYEAQQAPLAYMLLVPFDLAVSRVQLRWRVLILRLVVAIAAALLLYFALSKLDWANDCFLWSAGACIFSSQMLWATLAHIGNDYLAAPLTVLFLAWLIKAAKTKSRSDSFILALLLTAGLLTKAYFIAFIPVFIALMLVQTRFASVIVPLAVTGPWYLHNRLLYGSFTGTQQAVAGIGFVQALFAVPKIPWPSSILAFLHWSLWTGNWSFLSFSKATLNAELILIGLGLVLYFARFRAISVPERWALAACACFLAALVYQTCVTYIHTHGASLFAEPWYWQGIVCFVWVLAFRGFEQSQLLGRALAVVTILLTAWIAAITYIAKLFPLYGGGFQRATLSRVWTWWTTHPTQDLRTVPLAPPKFLYVLLGLLLLLLGAQTALLGRRLIGRG